MPTIDSQGHEVPTEHIVPRLTTGEVARAASAAAARAVAGRGRTDADVNALIERFGRHPNGYLHARVVVGGKTFYLHRRFGSWLAPGQVNGREVLKEPEGLLGSVLGREVKVALQAKARPIELAERRERERKESEHAQDRSGDSGGNDEAGPDAGLPARPDSQDADDEVRPDGE